MRTGGRRILARRTIEDHGGHRRQTFAFPFLLNAALEQWWARWCCLKSFALATHRVDLTGAPAGELTHGEHAEAAARLEAQRRGRQSV
jgi:hypothetical protein